MKTLIDYLNYKIISIIFSTLLLVPSIFYLVVNKSLMNLSVTYNLFYLPYIEKGETFRFITGILYFVIFIIIAYSYYKLLKDRKKYFKSKNGMIAFVIITSLIYTCILPMTSSDVFYYMATGHIEAKYDVNPYYTTVQDIIDNNDVEKDNIIQKSPTVWRETLVVYGPLNAKVNMILSKIAGDNINISLFVFKLFNLIIHLINMYLIYIITNKKKVFALIYGINPFVLFELLSNVHNESLMILFMLCAMYFLIKKKRLIPSIIMLALATTVKYIAILIVPFVVIYFLKDKKVSQRIIISICMAIIYTLTIVTTYLICYGNIEILLNMFNQQDKISQSIYIALVVVMNVKTALIVAKVVLLIFAIIYMIIVMKLLFSTKISKIKVVNTYTLILLTFLFIVLTNFKTWYLLWLIPSIFLQRGKVANCMIDLGIASQLANIIFFAYSEAYVYGVQFLFLLFGFTAILQIYRYKTIEKST